jgi:hypothetical protein
VTLPPGNYTVHLKGVNNGTGVGLIGVDESDTSPLSRLANISTRGRVLTGNDIMIGGFIISGMAPKQVLVRCFGPTLSSFGVPNPLADPTCTLYSGGTPIVTNDNYQTPVTSCNSPAVSCGAPQEIIDTGKSACEGYAPGNPNCGLDAALLVTLPPGNYTVHLSGVNHGTGVGLVGVDEISP